MGALIPKSTVAFTKWELQVTLDAGGGLGVRIEGDMLVFSRNDTSVAAML